MTSKHGASECFVYIMLPGTNEFVTAGRFVLEPDRTGVPVGRFVYGKSYLDNPDAVPIDPIELKLANTTYQTTALKGVFGALRDAGPDYWGRGASSKNMQACLSSARSTICSTPLMTAPVRSASVSEQNRPLRKENSTRHSIWKN